MPAALDGFRILHLSDTHLTRFWFKAYDRLIAQINESSPDVICFTGDLVDSRWNASPAFANAERLARALRARYGVFAVIGNHDGDMLAPHIPRWGWTLLHPGIARIKIDAAEIEIIGLPCVSRLDVTPRLLRRFPTRDPGVTRIVLSHYPDHVRILAPIRPDVILAGHTHGGQCCLPGGRPIITHDSLPRAMAKGVHRVGDSWLVISRGFGFATYPMRTFCPGEVAEIVLRRIEQRSD
jgi:predicted MPP superfamily phosphohydrolase